MKSLSFLFFFIVCNSILSFCQLTKIKGVVSIQNSRQATGRIRYVYNAEIDEAFGRGTTTTDSEGRFEISLVGVNENESVSLSIKKEGFEVINSEALRVVANQKDVIKIFMCPTGQLAENRRKYYVIAKSEYEKNLEKKISELEKEKRIQSLQNMRRISEINTELQKLCIDLKKADSIAQIFANTFAEMNLDEATENIRQSYKLFIAGKLDEAMNLFRPLDYGYNIAIKNRQKLARKKELINKEEIEQKDFEQNVIMENKYRINLFTLAYKWDSVGKAYEQIIALDSANAEEIFNYGNFLSRQNKQREAVNYYKLYVEKEKDSSYIIDGFNALIGAYRMINEDSSLLYYHVLEKILQRHPDYRLVLSLDPAVVLNWANTLSREDAKKAESLYRQSVQLNLSRVYRANMKLMPSILSDFGKFFLDYQMYDSAKKYLELSLLFWDSSNVNNEIDYTFGLSITTYNLGIAYFNLKDLQAAEKFFLQTEELRNILDLKYNFNVDQRLLNIYYSLIEVYFQKKEFQKVQRYLDKVFIILKENEVEMPLVQKIWINETQMLLLIENGQVDSAEYYFNLNLKLINEKFLKDSNEYLLEIEKIYSTKADALTDRATEKAVEAYSKAEECLDTIVKSDRNYLNKLNYTRIELARLRKTDTAKSNNYIRGVENTLSDPNIQKDTLPYFRNILNLGNYLLLSGNYEKGFSYLRNVDSSLEKFHFLNNIEYEQIILSAKNDLCFLYVEKKADVNAAEMLLIECLEIYKRNESNLFNWSKQLDRDIRYFYQLKERSFSHDGSTFLFIDDLKKISWLAVSNYLNSLYHDSIAKLKNTTKQKELQFKIVKNLENVIKSSPNDSIAKKKLCNSYYEYLWLLLLNKENDVARAIITRIQNENLLDHSILEVRIFLLLLENEKTKAKSLMKDQMLDENILNEKISVFKEHGFDVERFKRFFR